MTLDYTTAKTCGLRFPKDIEAANAFMIRLAKSKKVEKATLDDGEVVLCWDRLMGEFR